MKAAGSLQVELGSSRLATALISVSFVATAALLAWLPSEPVWVAALKASAAIAIGTYAVGTLRGWATRSAQSSIIAIELKADLRIALTERCGRRIEGRVLPDSYVGGWLTTIVMRPEGRRLARTIAIVFDMLPVEDFRRLRVLLRLGKATD